MSSAKKTVKKGKHASVTLHASASDDLSDYEKIRLDHIKRNHEFMQQLGLFSIKESISEDFAKEKTGPKRPIIKAPPLPEELRRRSARMKNETPQYTSETIDRFGEKLDAAAARTSTRKRSLAEFMPEAEGDNAEDVDYDALKDEMREAAMRHMEQVRKAMLPTAIEDEATAAPDEWREEAVRRWGTAAGAVHRLDWRGYVQSRLSTPPPVSPIDFLQEYYAADTWRLLVACILMSRVSSLDTKHTCISIFFSIYPTPSAFFEERDWSRVRSQINSLGLFDDRLKALIALTTRFIEVDIFEVSPDPKCEHKIRGVGAFGYESYLVFCKDEGATIKLSDGGKPLAPFVAWRKKHAEKTAT
jgi:methyl-CpG-binding domain protein 4